MGVLGRKHVDYPDVIYRKVPQVKVEGDPSIQVQMDGELAGSLPMSFSVSEKGAQILIAWGLYQYPALGRGPFLPTCSILRISKSSWMFGLLKLILLICSAIASNLRQSSG